MFRTSPQAERSELALLLFGSEPAALGNVEDDPVGILELALEVDFVLALTEVEEERAAGVFDALLRLGDVVDDEPEMVRAGEILGVLEAGAELALERQQREVDDAVAQVDAGTDLQILAANPLEPEDVLIERRGFFQI